ncbi:ATP-dependent helicase HrpB [Shewanella submarina]|uniref:ATP-dependent helicase HrpB n=1 Tax=Shewanella submarina TaxID=2016376 RepID=A0ABV7GIF9_9GAMM|nr:ATP-dependent helicase HrpB [Shewanella submarina]MCL1035907.1 ATP-dependent helicase HrpB [Shewanella submarina]
MNQLPIQQLFTPLRNAFSHANQVILQAPTGAGKSTALPLAMLDWPEINGRIIMLEPRRVAARSVAHFVAAQRGQNVGQEVGYRVRGESRVSKQTRLEVVTEGVLTRMIQQDPELDGIGLIIFDEIHERHLTTDLSLALALEVQASLRDDLRILAMSATLSGLPLETLMPDAPLLESEGRSFPVEVCYRAPKAQQDWIAHMGQELVSLLQSLPQAVANNEHNGVLAFLPGKGEILKLQAFLQQRLASDKYGIFPLYGELTGKEQDAAVAPLEDGRIKVVLSTNVAESSLTIHGISMVVDSGYKRHAGFNPKTGTSRLSLKRISQASSIQRSGRAGRLAPGYSLRLWSQDEFDRQPKAEDAEILHTDLLSMALDCANWGARRIDELSLMTPPPAANEAQAWDLLKSLQLVDIEHKLTAHGREAYELGSHPRLAHMLLKAKTLETELADQYLLPLACMLAAVLEGRGLPRRGEDISNYLQLACKGQLAAQANRWLKQFGRQETLTTVAGQAHLKDIGLLLALAYPDRIAKRRGIDGFQLANGTGVNLAPESSLAHQEYLVVADFQQSEGRSSGRVYLASAFDPEWLNGPLAFLVQEMDECSFDEQSGRVSAQRCTRLGSITLKSSRLQNIDRDMIKSAMLGLVERKGLQLLDFNEDVQQFCTRVQLAREYDAGFDWPDFSELALVAHLSDWLAPYLDNVSTLAQLGKLNCKEMLTNALPWELQQRLKQILPCRWPLATGTHAPVRYEVDGRALLSVRLQEAFGMEDSPQLLNGKLKVTMELLSPARRPLALTSDLASFWAGPYVDVKKEMRGRYPKHVWPDDPVNTIPTKHTKKYSQNKA